jgi:hypothetical protein
MLQHLSPGTDGAPRIVGSNPSKARSSQNFEELIFLSILYAIATLISNHDD